jgi:hypothetical protein
MTWEFRFVNMPSGNGGEDWFELREVYYNDDSSLMGHSNPCVGSETTRGMAQLARWWTRASQLPALHEKDFPADFEPEAYT